MYLYHANNITVAPIQIGHPVGMVVEAAACEHRNLQAKQTHPVSATRATDPAMRGRSCVLSERIKPSDWTASFGMVSCPALFLQSEPTDGRMLRRDRTVLRPTGLGTTGEPTVTSWSALLN